MALLIASWDIEKKYLLGLMIKFETPPLWITISPAVVQSPIFLFLTLCGKKIELNNIDILQTTLERAKLIAKDPVPKLEKVPVIMKYIKTRFFHQ